MNLQWEEIMLYLRYMMTDEKLQKDDNSADTHLKEDLDKDDHHCSMHQEATMILNQEEKHGITASAPNPTKMIQGDCGVWLWKCW